MSSTIALNTWSLEGKVLRGEMSLADVVEATAAMGVQGIDINEMYMGFNPNPDPALLRSIRRLCESFGLKITSCWFWGDLLAAVTMESLDAAVAHITRYLAVMETLRSSSLTISNGSLPPGVAVEEARSILRRLYERLGPIAEDHGVVIGFEAARAGTPFNSPQGALELVKEFDSPFLTLTPDFESWRRPTEKMPMRYAEDPDSVQAEPLAIHVFADCLPYSPFIHAKFLEFDETGTDPNYPLDEMFAAVRAGGRDHVFTIEYEGWIPDIHPERDAATETRKAIDLIRKQLVL
jgi:sugar phosphate isomerase/epimerase